MEIVGEMLFVVRDDGGEVGWHDWDSCREVVKSRAKWEFLLISNLCRPGAPNGGRVCLLQLNIFNGRIDRSFEIENPSAGAPLQPKARQKPPQCWCFV